MPNKFWPLEGKNKQHLDKQLIFYDKQNKEKRIKI